MGWALSLGLTGFKVNLARAQDAASAASSEVAAQNQSGAWKQETSCYATVTSADSSQCKELQTNGAAYDREEPGFEQTTKSEEAAGEQAVLSAQQVTAATQASDSPNTTSSGQQAQQLFLTAAQHFQSCVEAATQGLSALDSGSSKAAGGSGFIAQNSVALRQDLRACGNDGSCKQACESMAGNEAQTFSACQGGGGASSTTGTDGNTYGPGLSVIKQICQQNFEAAQCMAGGANGNFTRTYSNSGPTKTAGDGSTFSWPMGTQATNYTNGASASHCGNIGAISMQNAGASANTSSNLVATAPSGASATPAFAATAFPTSELQNAPLVTTSSAGDTSSSSSGSVVTNSGPASTLAAPLPSGGPAPASAPRPSIITSGTTLSLGGSDDEEKTAAVPAPGSRGSGLTWTVAEGTASSSNASTAASSSAPAMTYNSVTGKVDFSQAAPLLPASAKPAAGTQPWTPVNKSGTIFQMNALVLGRQVTVKKAGQDTLALQPLTLFELGERGYHGIDEARYQLLSQRAQNLNQFAKGQSGGKAAPKAPGIVPASLATK